MFTWKLDENVFTCFYGTRFNPFSESHGASTTPDLLKPTDEGGNLDAASVRTLNPEATPPPLKRTETHETSTSAGEEGSKLSL